MCACMQGVKKDLAIDPKTLHHAKWLNIALRNAHKEFRATHEKNCQGPICPNKNTAFVSARAVF